jgi:hypothetical protein
MPTDEKIIAYLGPSFPLHRAVELCPNVIFRPPACQGDILSDAVEIQPDRILLIDGEFLQNLSVWHKELIFCMSKEIKVYGAASMGALRSADLWRLGMVGTGQIFEWYKNGVTEDDSEVALLYHLDAKGLYHSTTVPLVDIRATITHYAETLAISVDHQQAMLAAARVIHFSTRTNSRLLQAWTPILNKHAATFLANNIVNQKYFDAEYLLTNYRTLKPAPESLEPAQGALSKFFWAQYDRDRRVTISGVRVAQQHIEAHVALGSVDQHQIFWDAKNFYLTHILAEKLGIQVTEAEVQEEQHRFVARHGIADIEEWCRENNLTQGEAVLIAIRMAMVRRLHHWLISTLVPLESTKITLDYLKMHNAYSYWAKECAQQEAKLQALGVDDTLSIKAGELIDAQLAAHMQKSGQTLEGHIEDFVTETGFSNRYELMVALERLKHLETP